MKERPILMSAPMVRALLAGAKTQTRRAIKPQPVEPFMFDDVHSAIVFDHGGKYCPYGTEGDRLWVRETFLLRGNGTHCVYRADADPVEAAGFGAMYGGWKPSIFMPRKFSRIKLQITGVRVERLQSITEPDAKAEGCAPAWLDEDDNESVHAAALPTYRRGYAKLWRDINGKGSWEANPLVWVIEFKRLEQKQ